MWKGAIICFLAFTSSVVRGQAEVEAENTLKKVQVVFRHGAKYPMRMRWTDDCTQSYRSEQLGNLTQKGRTQMSFFGDHLRTTYDKLIASDSSQVDILYSDYYRDLESGQLVGEALFRTYNVTPVQMTKIELSFEGPMFHIKGYLVKWLESLPFKNKYQGLCERLDEKQGVQCKGLFDVAFMADQLYCETSDGCVLPDWLDKETQTRILEFFTDLSEWLTKCSSKSFIKEHSDQLITAINKKFVHTKEQDYKKMDLYALHDINLQILLRRIGAHLSPDEMWPNVGAALFLEQHSVGNESFMRAYYDNTLDYTGLRQLRLGDCELECPIQDFLRITSEGPICHSSNKDSPQQMVDESLIRGDEL